MGETAAREEKQAGEWGTVDSRAGPCFSDTWFSEVGGGAKEER